MSKEQLLFSDLDALDSSPASVREAFKDYFGKNPDGIALNSETYYDAVKPAITEQYGHYCYKTLQDITYNPGPVESQDGAVLGSNYAVNRSDEPATLTLTISGSWSDSTTVSSEVTTGMSYSSEFTVKGVFSMGSSFSITTTAGKSSTTSVTQTATSQVQVTVPPRSKQKVSMIGTMKSQTIYFTAPIDVSGMFGANFPKRVNGHYFWFLSSGQVLNKTSGTLSGTIKNTSAFDVSTDISPAEPL